MPRTVNCTRKFRIDEAKRQSMVEDIEKDAAGLQSTTSPPFCPLIEKDVKRVATVIQNLKDFPGVHGRDPVFRVVKPSGKSLNAFKHPGPLTKTPVDGWADDLKSLGIQNGLGGRRPLCSRDGTNLD